MGRCAGRRLSRRALPLLALAFATAALVPVTAAPPALAEDAAVPRPGTGTAFMSGDLTAGHDAEIFHGKGFDTCQAPPADVMHDWLDSSYRAIGVYIGGHGRACKEQPHLTPDWVREVSAQGWRLLPLYVGSQSPCVRLDHKRDVALDPGRADPRAQGASEARDAIARAEALGLAPGSPIYLDMEAYDEHDTACAAATLAFTQGFVRELRDGGWIAGYYSSADSGIRHLEAAREAGADDLPDVLWYARWDTAPTLYAEPALDSRAWQPHRRVHQYAGNVRETHGGSTLLIDRNLVHAPVAVLSRSSPYPGPHPGPQVNP